MIAAGRVGGAYGASVIGVEFCRRCALRLVSEAVVGDSIVACSFCFGVRVSWPVVAGTGYSSVIIPSQAYSARLLRGLSIVVAVYTSSTALKPLKTESLQHLLVSISEVRSPTFNFILVDILILFDLDLPTAFVSMQLFCNKEKNQNIYLTQRRLRPPGAKRPKSLSEEYVEGGYVKV